MKAEFKKAIENNAIAVQLTPESPAEALLLEAFLRFDENVIQPTVFRAGEASTGAIEWVTLKGGAS